MKTEKIKLKSLVTEGLQIRCAMDKDAIADYAEAMEDGAKLPPIIVFREKDKFYLADGFHRVEAARMNGADEIDAEVREGGFNDALRHALGANASHGLRRSNADKRRALGIAWQNRTTLFGRTNPKCRDLANVCGVSHNFANEFIRSANLSSDDKNSTGDESAAEPEGVKANLAKGLDRFGVAIPENLLPAFKGAADVRKLSREVQALRNSLEDRFKSNDLAFAAIPQQALINLDNAMHEIKSGQAYCVCRGCSGTGCYRCSDHGFQTGAQYRKMPEEYKAKEA